MFPLVIETYVKGDLYQSVQIGNFKSRRAAKRAARSTLRSACTWPSHLSRVSLGLARIGADEVRAGDHMQIVNLTPHPVLVTTGQHAGNYPPAGEVARVENLPYGPVRGLPDRQPDTILIVSVLVAEALPYRDDLRVPGEQERDASGRIVGCRSLVPPLLASPALVGVRRMMMEPAGRWLSAGLYALRSHVGDHRLHAELPARLANHEVGPATLRCDDGPAWRGAVVGDPQTAPRVDAYAGGLEELADLLRWLGIPASRVERLPADPD